MIPFKFFDKNGCLYPSTSTLNTPNNYYAIWYFKEKNEHGIYPLTISFKLNNKKRINIFCFNEIPSNIPVSVKNAMMDDKKMINNKLCKDCNVIIDDLINKGFFYAYEYKCDKCSLIFQIDYDF